jgi:hypothetical protein
MHDLASGRDEMLDELMTEAGHDTETSYGQGEEELAAELLELGSDQELDQFFGKIMKGAKRFLKSPTGKMLTGALRGVAKTALPMAGKAVGNMFAPGLGGAVGGQVGGMLGSLFETEGLSEEEAELEIAKRVVRTAQQAARQVASDPRAVTDPASAVRSAIGGALQAHLPGVLGSPRASGGGSGQSGRWYRRGNRIVLTGA